MATVIEHIDEVDFVQNMLFCTVRNSKQNISYDAASCEDVITRLLDYKFGGISGKMAFLFSSDTSIISVYDYIKEKNPHFTSNHPYLQDIYKKIFVIDTDFNFEDIEIDNVYHSCINKEVVVNPEIIEQYLDKYSEFNKKEENLDVTIFDFNTEENGNVRFTLIRDFTLVREDGIEGDIYTVQTYPDIFVEYELND